MRCLGVLWVVERQRARDVHLLSGPKIFIFEETLSFLLVFWVIYKKFTALISSRNSSFLVWKHVTQDCLLCSQGELSYCLFVKEYVKEVIF